MVQGRGGGGEGGGGGGVSETKYKIYPKLVKHPKVVCDDILYPLIIKSFRKNAFFLPEFLNSSFSAKLV